MNLLEAIELHLPRGFAIREPLGAGATARVYLAVRAGTDECLVVKVMRPGTVRSQALDRFQAEMRMLRALDHPRIVPILEVGEANGALFFTMPYLGSETLRSRLDAAGALPVRETLLFARDLADALGHAHAKGLVHRDVKPENILLSGGSAYLMDFGFAHPPERMGGNGGLADPSLIYGTPDYVSPEQVEGKRVPDWRSDFFSLGCVMLEMLAGVPPFTAGSPRATMRRRLTTPAVDVRVVRAEVPADVAAIVRCNLEIHPSGRFATASALRAAIDGALSRLDAGPSHAGSPDAPR